MPIGVYSHKKGWKHSRKTLEKISKANQIAHRLKLKNDPGYREMLIKRIVKGNRERSGKKHWQWKGGRMKDKDGYILILKKKHPLANNFGYVREHRLVVEKKLGRYLNPSESVHHLNGIKDDNRLENLWVFDSEDKHRKLGLARFEMLQKRIRELEQNAQK